MENETILLQRNNENDESVESSEDAQEDIWDDSLLIKAYDRAVSLAKAKRDKISAAVQNNKVTNAATEPKDSQAGKSNKKLKKGSKQSQNVHTWKVGTPCRSVYSEDGVEYEAVIIKMMEWKKKCIVHYIGYNNEEEVDIDQLKASKGETVRQQQMAEAACQMEFEENVETQRQQLQQEQVPDGYRAKFPSSFQASSSGILPPPPPPHIMSNLPKTETEALSAMLMSWYMSGYHTGYYFGLANSNLRQMSEIQKTDSGKHFKKK